MSQAVRFWIRAPHLTAACAALAATVVFLWVLFGVVHIDRRLAHFAAPQFLDVKDLSVALQEDAFADKRILPIYGSSEFRNDTPYSGRIFFSHFPTGFELFSIGKAGAKTLIVAERIAALGNAVRGKKLVIILSPTWFLAKTENSSPYDGNFSALQAGDFAFNSPISRSLRRAIAREMLHYPETLRGHGLLRLELQRLAASKRSPEDRLLGELGRSGDEVMELLDRCRSMFALSTDLLRDPETLADRHPGAKTKLDWDGLLQKAAVFSDHSSYASSLTDPNADDGKDAQKLVQEFRGSHSMSLTSRLDSTDEWYHLELLLRTLRELGAKPLIISIPINATSFGFMGVTPAQREYYHARLRNEVRDFGYPLATFERDETNPNFFGDSMGHPSALGWMTFNRTIDQFYHDKLPAHLD